MTMHLQANLLKRTFSTRFLLFLFLALSILFIALPVYSEAEFGDENYEESQDVDPWQGVNRRVFKFNSFVDRWLLKPAAKSYQWITPSFVDRGVTSFFKNLGDVTSLLNSGLQGDFRQMGVSTGRFIVNSTVGVGGFIDVASKAGLERRPEDFGQTLAVWGVGSGPYVELPFLGGRHLRHAFSLVPDFYLSPIAYVNDTDARWVLTGLQTVDTRADLFAAEALLSGDRYSFIRDVYMQRRDSLIDNGQNKDGEDPFGDDFGDEDDF